MNHTPSCKHGLRVIIAQKITLRNSPTDIRRTKKKHEREGKQNGGQII